MVIFYILISGVNAATKLGSKPSLDVPDLTIVLMNEVAPQSPLYGPEQADS